MVRSVPRASAGLSRLAASPVPAVPPRTNQRMGLVNKHHDGDGAGLHLLDHALEAVLELALHRGAGLQQTDVKRQHPHITQGFGYIAARDAQGKAFHPRPSCQHPPLR